MLFSVEILIISLLENPVAKRPMVLQQALIKLVLSSLLSIEDLTDLSLIYENVRKIEV